MDVEFEEVEEGVVYEVDCAVDFWGGIYVNDRLFFSSSNKNPGGLLREVYTFFNAKVQFQWSTSFVALGKGYVLEFALLVRDVFAGLDGAVQT